MTTLITKYAPVDQVEIDPSSIEEGVLRGYAAPNRGPKPCLLELVAGRTVLALAPACGFSKKALLANVRFGWCGFELGGLTVAGAFGETVQVRCAVSGDVIDSWIPEKLLLQLLAETRGPIIRVIELQEVMRGFSGCSDLSQIVPFAEQFRSSHDDRDFVNASYLYLHKRRASDEELDDFVAHLPADWDSAVCWNRIVNSDEFTSQRRFPVPGVFSAAFPYGLGVFA
jgi:hypothetical protein